MAIRVTINTIRAGQPRPYADSVYEEHVFLEHTPWNAPDEFKPWELTNVSISNIPTVLSQYIPTLRLPVKAKAGTLASYVAQVGPIEGKPGWYRIVSISPFID